MKDSMAGLQGWLTAIGVIPFDEWCELRRSDDIFLAQEQCYAERYIEQTLAEQFPWATAE